MNKYILLRMVWQSLQILHVVYVLSPKVSKSNETAADY